MIELLMSDSAILLMCGAGLVATTISIVRDTRTQRAQMSPRTLTADEMVPDRLRDAA